MIEKEIINTKKILEIFYQEIYYDVGNSILITSWYLEFQIKELEHLIDKSH